MRARARLGLVVLTLIAAATGAIGPVSPASAAAGPTSSGPKVGQCHQLTWRQVAALADGKRAVSCSARHNLQTIAVVTAPTSLAGLTDEEHAELGSRLCAPRYDKALGRTAARRQLTVYSLFFFAPSPSQIAAGDRRIRCDVGKVAVDHLVALPKHRLARPIVAAHIADGERRCLTSRWYVTPCTTKHVLRSTTAFVLRQTAYPTPAQVGPVSARKCPRGTDTVVWASERGWAHGNHVAICYDKTRK